MPVVWIDKEAAIEGSQDIAVHSYTPATQRKGVSEVLESLDAASGPVGLDENIVVGFFQGSIKAEQNLGISLEDTVIVTASGVEMLTAYPREMFPVLITL